MMRQIADEADRIAEQNAAPILEVPLPRARVQRREQLVLDVDAGAGQGVHQRAFAGVGVADQRDRMFLAAAAHLALLARLHLDEPRFQIADAQIDEPAVFFELRFAGAAQCRCRRSMRPRWLHICRRRGRAYSSWASSTCKRASMERARVAKMSRISSLRSSTLTLGGFFEIADLARRQIVVEDDRRRRRWPATCSCSSSSLPLPM